MEIAETDLEKLIINKINFNFSEQYELFRESINVLVKLKEKKLSHLDIKP